MFGAWGVDVVLGDVVALRGVDLAVPHGSVNAVVGGDGAGKTTLLRCLVGRLDPTAGRVRRPGRSRIGYMPATSGTWRDLTVEENIDFVASAYSMSQDHRRRRRRDLLERAGLTDVTDRPAGQLSGGMRQKLGFVVAVLHQPELLVLDEPSTGVDPVSRVELWRLVAEAAAGGAAVAMATSYLDEAERASTITVLDQGHVLAAGTRDQVMASVPGVITAPEHPAGAEHTWRRGRTVRQWLPEPAVAGSEPAAGPALADTDLELEDVVIALMMHREARTTTAQP